MCSFITTAAEALLETESTQMQSSGKLQVVFEKWRSKDGGCWEKARRDQAMEKAAGLFGRGTSKGHRVLIAGIEMPLKKVKFLKLTEMLIEAGLFQEALNVINTIPPQALGNFGPMSLGHTARKGSICFLKPESMPTRPSLNPRYAPALNLKGVLACTQEDRSAAIDFYQGNRC
jgi:hypothetical protein